VSLTTRAYLHAGLQMGSVERVPFTNRPRAESSAQTAAPRLRVGPRGRFAFGPRQGPQSQWPSSIRSSVMPA
jgi:hypothetical protein